MPLTDGSRLLRATFRSAPFVVSYQGAGLLLVALSTHPAARPLLGAESGDVARGVGAILLTNLASTWAFHARGEAHRGYLLAALVEVLTYQISLMWLIYRSGSGTSFFWIFWLGQVAVNSGIVERHRLLLAIYTTPPLVLAASFAVGRGDTTGALACVLGAVVGFMIFSAGLRANVRLARAITEREAALAELAELRVRDERSRIARDLHDGVAADLVAVAMRADWARTAPADQQSQELHEIAGRTREAIDDLRSVVWSMRSPTRTPGELATYVEQRCRELCGRSVAFEMRATLLTEEPIPGACALDLVRIAQESCRNAIRHAAPRRVEARLSLGERVEWRVEDDGEGLPEGAESRAEGGLANLRTRVARRGGLFEVRRLPRGTGVSASFPLA